jgi:hypothetical protein
MSSIKSCRQLFFGLPQSHWNTKTPHLSLRPHKKKFPVSHQRPQSENGRRIKKVVFEERKKFLLHISIRTNGALKISNVG